MPRNINAQDLEKSIGKGERQIARLNQMITAQEQMLKADASLAAMYSRKARTHRLCKRGAMVEKFLQAPDLLTDDQVMALLRIAFEQRQTQEALSREIEKAKSTAAIPEQNTDRRNYTPSR